MSSVNKKEIEKFSNMADEWWDPHSKFKPLHKFNPIRIKYIKEKELQNKENKQEIILDKDLGSLLNCGSETVTYFSIQKYMNQHFIHNSLNNV